MVREHRGRQLQRFDEHVNRVIALLAELEAAALPAFLARALSLLVLLRTLLVTLLRHEMELLDDLLELQLAVQLLELILLHRLPSRFTVVRSHQLPTLHHRLVRIVQLQKEEKKEKLERCATKGRKYFPRHGRVTRLRQVRVAQQVS